MAKQYYNQNPRLLALRAEQAAGPGDLRQPAAVRDRTSSDIAQLALEAGILKQPIAFEEYADTRFSENTTGAGPVPVAGDLRERP